MFAHYEVQLFQGS